VAAIKTSMRCLRAINIACLSVQLDEEVVISHLTVNAMSSSRNHGEPAGMSADGSADHFIEKAVKRRARATCLPGCLQSKKESSSRSAVNPGSARVLCGANARVAAACRGDDEVSASRFFLLTWQLISAESVALRSSS